jgi:hypothetical protein
MGEIEGIERLLAELQAIPGTWQPSC